MRVRLGVLGITGGRAARTRDEADFGAEVRWIEIDGHRYTEGCSSAKVTLGGHAVSTAVVTLEGTVEVVTVDADGEPLEYENQPSASLSIPTTARVPLDQTSEGLIMALQRLGNEYGPTGVAETAAQMVGWIPAGEQPPEPSAPETPAEPPVSVRPVVARCDECGRATPLQREIGSVCRAGSLTDVLCTGLMVRV